MSEYRLWIGGVKCSGLGVEFARQGMEAYTTIQVLHG